MTVLADLVDYYQSFKLGFQGVERKFPITFISGKVLAHSSHWNSRRCCWCFIFEPDSQHFVTPSICLESRSETTRTVDWSAHLCLKPSSLLASLKNHCLSTLNLVFLNPIHTTDENLSTFDFGLQLGAFRLE